MSVQTGYINLSKNSKSKEVQISWKTNWKDIAHQSKTNISYNRGFWCDQKSITHILRKALLTRQKKMQKKDEKEWMMKVRYRETR